MAVTRYEEDDAGDEDAAFIAAAREAVPALVAEVRSLREAVYGPRDMDRPESVECLLVRLREERDHYREKYEKLVDSLPDIAAHSHGQGQEHALADALERCEDFMCPSCCTPWKCNGCDEHGRHNCPECHTRPRTKYCCDCDRWKPLDDIGDDGTCDGEPKRLDAVDCERFDWNRGKRE